MTGGKGQRSRVFRTADGCRTWTLAFTNPEHTGSFDSLKRVTSKQVYLLGEPVAGKFTMYLSQDSGATWFVADDPGLDAERGESAVGSTLTAQGAFLYFGTGGGSHPFAHYTYAKCNAATPDAGCAIAWQRHAVAESTGTLRSIAIRTQTSMSGKISSEIAAVGVGSDPAQPLAVFSRDDGATWKPAVSQPVAPDVAIGFDGATQTWIAVVAKGTDLSFDGGKHWSRMKPEAGATEDDGGWSALSLPFAVGMNGNVGMLDRARLKR